MSRVGNLPISIPARVTVTVEGNTVKVKGSKGELSRELNELVDVTVEEGEVRVSRKNEEKQTRAVHGLYRSLINNMITGVSVGFKKQLELVGVGYRANAKGNLLELSIGFSHNVVVELPEEVKVEAQTERGQNPVVTLESMDNQLLGQVAAKIRSLRKPEPYKGKGIRFVGEQIRRKAGKTAAK